MRFVSPKEHSYDRSVEALDFSVVPANSIPSLDEVVKQWEASLPGFQLANIKDGTVDGHLTKMVTYNYTDTVWDLT